MQNTKKQKTKVNKKATKEEEITYSVSSSRKSDATSASAAPTDTAKDKAFEDYLRIMGMGITNQKEIQVVRALIENSKEYEDELLFWGTQVDLQNKAKTSNKPVQEVLKKLADLGLIEKRQLGIKVSSILANIYKKIQSGKSFKVEFTWNFTSEQSEKNKQLDLVDMIEKEEQQDKSSAKSENKADKEVAKPKESDKPVKQAKSEDKADEKVEKPTETTKPVEEKPKEVKSTEKGNQNTFSQTKKAGNTQPSDKPQNQTENKPKPHNSARFNGDLNLKQPQEFKK